MRMLFIVMLKAMARLRRAVAGLRHVTDVVTHHGFHEAFRHALRADTGVVSGSRPICRAKARVCAAV